MNTCPKFIFPNKFFHVNYKYPYIKIHSHLSLEISSQVQV